MHHYVKPRSLREKMFGEITYTLDVNIPWKFNSQSLSIYFLFLFLIKEKKIFVQILKGTVIYLLQWKKKYTILAKFRLLSLVKRPFKI